MQYEQNTANYRENALVQSFFMQVYGWMFAGLLATGVMAYYTANSPAMLEFVFGSKYTFYGLLIGELLLVIAINGAIRSLSATMASALFFIYSALNGLTLSAIFLVYTQESITLVFFITAGTFGAMSVYGYMTKSDLSALGNILMMALLGLIIATVVNFFLQSPGLMWALSYLGVLVFVGLTAYDTQNIKKIAQQVNDENTLEKMAVLGALNLYLDFINLFLYLLRFFGKRK